MKTKLIVLMAILAVVSMTIAWVVYGWQLPVVMFLFAWSMNIQNRL